LRDYRDAIALDDPFHPLSPPALAVRADVAAVLA